jgi:hypothetical protein
MVITVVLTVILGALGIVFLGMAPKDAFIAGGLLAQILGLLTAPCGTHEAGDSSYGWVLVLALFSCVAACMFWLEAPYQFLVWGGIVYLLNLTLGMSSLTATTKFGKSPGTRVVEVRDHGVIEGSSTLLSILYIISLLMAAAWYITD